MRIFKLLGARAAWLAMRTAYQTGAVVAATRAMHTPTLAAIIAQRDEARALLASAMQSQESWRDIATAHIAGLRVVHSDLLKARQLAKAWQETAEELAAKLREERSAVVKLARAEGN